MADLSTHTPAMLMRDYIVAYAAEKGVGASLDAWPFKFGKMPSEPDQVIVLVDQSAPTLFPHLRVDYTGLQVMVRSVRGGAGYQSSYKMARTIRDMILGMPGAPAQFEELTGVTERSVIVPLGYDEQDRHMWSNNFQLLVEPKVNVLTHRESL